MGVNSNKNIKQLHETCNSKGPNYGKKKLLVLRSNEVVLSLPRMNDIQNVSLLCFSEASFENGKYTDLKGKLLLFLQGRNGISLVFKKAKVISPKYFNYRNISFRRGIKLIIIFKTP